MADPAARRGEIWLARLDKVRPAVILTRNPMGALLSRVVVAPVTSMVRGLATEVLLGSAAGIDHESAANLDNVLLITRSSLVRRVGQVPASTMVAICQALAIAVGCD